MKQGLITVGTATTAVKVADVDYNVEQMRDAMQEAESLGVKVLIFPELGITGYTCGELFEQDLLLKKAEEGLLVLAEETRKREGIYVVGLPFSYQGSLYNVAAVLNQGKVLALIPKTFLPNYAEFYEARYFTQGNQNPIAVTLKNGDVVPMGTRILITSKAMPELKLACEICEDLWTPCPPSTGHALAGATLIANLSASDEVTGKEDYRRNLVTGQSARLICGYLYASAGEGESTMDVVYSGHNLIAENGTLLAESERFTTGMICSQIDLQKLEAERRRISTYQKLEREYLEIPAMLTPVETKITRWIDPAPFVPGIEADRRKRCEEIFMIQAQGLRKRLSHTHCETAVIGISGGLDSTLALLVITKAFDLLEIPRDRILAVTMPGFGTTDRTYDNSLLLVKTLGATLKEIDIREGVNIHFRDIDHDSSIHDVTYENSQARMRTMILMNLANQHNGMVIGTGDMSELALGWATYNGDHMSMYGVNAGVPKTLVRHLVRYEADVCRNKELSAVLEDVLDTPVSPELLPPDENGKIAQKTEDIVGPYELHDFFLYYVLRFGFAPAKIYRLAKLAFGGTYEETYILKWMKTFFRRFFNQQFKRSCLPDGPKVGSVAVSPRGDLRMPSDAMSSLWMKEIEKLS